MHDNETRERDRLVEQIRSIRYELEREGVRHVTLFGSRARGDARPDSDVDIAIDIAPGIGFSLLNLVGVEEIVRQAVNLPANAVMRRSLETGFRNQLAEHGIDVF